jgi:diguanylate cyclase (GGDEF)-like protein
LTSRPRDNARGATDNIILARLSPDQRIWVVSSCLALITLGLYLTVVRHLEPIHSLPLPWWALGAMFCLGEVFVVQFDIRQDAVSFSLSEIPLVLGLFFVDPASLLLAQVVGAGAALALHRRQKAIKLAFNLSLLSFQACVALLLFHPIVSLGDPLGPSGWVGTLVVTHSLDVLSSVAVALVIALKGSKPMVVRGLLGVGTAITFANTGLALLAVIIVWTHPASSWLLLVTAAVVFLALHAHGSLRRTHNKLRVLYESSRAAETSTDIETMIVSILARARDMLRAEVAEITLFGSGVEEPASRMTLGPQERLESHKQVHLDPTQGVWARVVAEERGVLLPRPMRSERLRAHFAARGIRDVIVVPMRAEAGLIGTLLVANRMGDLATFDEEDLNLLETLARHLSVSLEQGRLLERLRQEAATNEYLARHDGLTGLPNRMWFLQRLTEAIAELSNRNESLAVVLMDLDRFKEVNDTLGHHNGDELLKEIGRRLRELPGEHPVARLGGDEFAVLLSTVEDTQTALEQARGIVRSLDAPIELEALQVDVRASAGLAVFPTDGEDASILLQRADVAMYLAKEAHSDCEPYSSERDPYSPTRLGLIAELRTAVEQRDVFLMYQPQVDLRTGDLRGLEALARWEHPSRGLVPPGEFIPIAEHAGIIKPLTLLALDTSLSERQSILSGRVAVPVSVNLSARTLQDESFPDDVTRLLDSYGVPASGLCLELTESSIMADPERSRSMLNRLSEAGIRLSMDDFGTGYSSLSYLSRLPLDEIKIDRSFVMRMARDARDASIVQSTIDLGHDLGLRVVAEGIEDEETFGLLLGLGCDIAQGYWISPPLRSSRLQDWLRDRSGMTPAGSVAVGVERSPIEGLREVEVLAEHRSRRRSG